MGVLALFEAQVIRRDTPLDALAANVFTWLCLMTFLGYGRRHLSFSSGLLKWAREASYPVYILHQTIIVMLGYAVVKLPWSPWTKYGFVLGATMLSCALLYEQLVRRFSLTRLLFGMKGEPSGAPIRASRPATSA